MLISRDSGLNMVLGFDDSLQNVVTQTILNQEEIFRHQVFELHRLYKIQKRLMDELDLKAIGGESPHSWIGPFPNNFKYEFLATETNLSEVHTICSSAYVKNHCLQERRGTLKHQRIPLDLELPASHYTDYGGEDLMCDSITPQVSAITEHGFYNDKPSSIEVHNADTWQKGSGQRTCKDNTICSPSQQTIHGRKLFASHEVGELDLNKALPDESSDDLAFDHWIPNPSNCNSSTVLSHNEVGEYGKITFSTVLDRTKDNHSTESETSFKDNTCPTTSLSEMNTKNNKEDKICSHYSSQELLEGTDSNRSPPSCNSDSIKDDVLSNAKIAGQCAIDMSIISNGPPSVSTLQDSESSQVDKKLNQQNGMSSTETKPQSPDSKNEKSDEVDITVRAGVVSLIYFSLQCSSRNQDHIIESKKRKERSDVKWDPPQSSSESYESIVLRQPECSVDEYCVTSMMSSEVALLDNKKDNHGVKLRRGRRMRDFRKEILPSLASLSRQEICEDVKIMESALRSREYKKYRSKGKSECFPSAVRSKRSRVRSVGRSYYS